MKLIAKKTPYSSIVGGGLALHDETGRTRFLVSICGTTEGITKQEDAEISDQLVRLINATPLQAAERKRG